MSAVAGGRSWRCIQPTSHRSFGKTQELAVYQSKPSNSWVGEIVASVAKHYFLDIIP